MLHVFKNHLTIGNRTEQAEYSAAHAQFPNYKTTLTKKITSSMCDSDTKQHWDSCQCFRVHAVQRFPLLD